MIHCNDNEKKKNSYMFVFKHFFILGLCFIYVLVAVVGWDGVGQLAT